mgnify:CR=1 FL=1
MACTPHNEESAESFVSLDRQISSGELLDEQDEQMHTNDKWIESINLSTNMNGYPNTACKPDTRLTGDRFASSARMSSPDMFDLSDEEEDDDHRQRNARPSKETDLNVD